MHCKKQMTMGVCCIVAFFFSAVCEGTVCPVRQSNEKNG